MPNGPGARLPEPVTPSLARRHREPAAALTPEDRQTLPGWPWVRVQMAAVITLAAPSMSWATALDGSRIAAATCVQLSPASTEGAYWTCGRR